MKYGKGDGKGGRSSEVGKWLGNMGTGRELWELEMESGNYEKWQGSMRSGRVIREVARKRNKRLHNMENDM